MKTPWSISTTIRNPERITGLLKVVDMIDGAKWDVNTQVKFQILLIQCREYGYRSTQFYSGLSRDIVNIIDDISIDVPYEIAEKAFKSKNYRDPPMRGRQSMNPLKKLGFASIENDRVKITKLGKKIISGEVDLGDALLRSFLKWQIPNPASRVYSFSKGYNVNPFICTISLISKVNEMEKERGNKPKGLSKREFELFIPSLINYQQIDDYVEKICHFRDIQVGLNKSERKEARDSYRQEFAREFLYTDNYEKTEKFLEALIAYGDNIIRCFRLTRLLCIRGNGFYIDIEPRRKVEIDEILKTFTGEANVFTSSNDYANYISDYNLPVLPWETHTKKLDIAKLILKDINECEKILGISIYSSFDLDTKSDNDLDDYIKNLRGKRASLQEQVNHNKSQAIGNLEKYINDLKNIFMYEDKSILLEKFVTQGLYALNDAIMIKPNYPVGDDNEPTFTAPSGVPDIECYYKKFNAICEVTMLKNRNQWYNEGQPVMRHLREFENKVKEARTNTFGIFIAPSIHRDTLNTFWNANKYEYEGSKQKIIPITINQFIKILEVLLLIKRDNKMFSHNELLKLFNSIISSISVITLSHDWLSNIEKEINGWRTNLSK